MKHTADSSTTIVVQLQALNRNWCVGDDTNPKDGSTTTDSDTTIDAETNIGNDNNTSKQQLDQPKKKTGILTPLEKARIEIISKLPPITLPSSPETKDSIVPYLFSALVEKEAGADENDEKDLSLSSRNPPAGKNKNAPVEYELRQIEWHVVLLLEVWSCASQSTDKEGVPSKSAVLQAFVNSILLYRDKMRQKNRNTNKKKRKKRGKNPKDPKPSATIASNKEKEKLFLDHLIEVISRAPFLLPRDLPFSEFLMDRIVSQQTHFWERIPRVVSHIFETFEIPNPYIPKPNGDGDDDGIHNGSLLLSSVHDEKPVGGKKKHADDATSAKERKPSREKLDAAAKNKKRQRLASLTSKKKHRGSHFHRNLDDISKLLEKKKKNTLLSKTCGKMAIAKSDAGTRSTLKERKATSNNLRTTNTQHRSNRNDPTVRKKMGSQTKNKNTLKRDRNRGVAETNAKRDKADRSREASKKLEAKGASEESSIEAPSTARIDAILDKKRKNSEQKTNHTSNSSSCSNETSNAEFLPMTPRRIVRSDTTLVVGETPVPKGNGMRFEAVVGETPVPGNGSRSLQTNAGETPTYENNKLGATPMSSAPFFSPPVLPSPINFPTASPAENTTIPSKQPVKLFGLLKRTNSISSRGKLRNWNGTLHDRVAANNSVKTLSAAETKNGGKRKANDSSSIDKARAFLRSKS